MTKYFSAALAVLAFSLLGCATSYSEALKQELAGKTVAEKRVILAQACRAEIRLGLVEDSAANVRHYENIRRICEEMTGQKIALD